LGHGHPRGRAERWQLGPGSSARSCRGVGRLGAADRQLVLLVSVWLTERKEIERSKEKGRRRCYTWTEGNGRATKRSGLSRVRLVRDGGKRRRPRMLPFSHSMLTHGSQGAASLGSRPRVGSERCILLLPLVSGSRGRFRTVACRERRRHLLRTCAACCCS
jgi:hypothetical protein